LAPFLPKDAVDELVFRAMEGKPLNRSQSGGAEEAPEEDAKKDAKQGASEKRGKQPKDWSAIHPEDVVETIQEEVLNALDIGQENLRQIKDAVWKSIDRFFRQNEDR
ncbi:MAG TPA: hypothetical protein PKE04_17175, partial [Clostridia bacterium]|nr:hypothetical protein [Clostridia bacterium]